MTAADDLDEFAAVVGARDGVSCAGGRTRWSVGGALDPAARVVRAPSGIVAHEPAEMTVRVRAGTTVVDLQDHLRAAGQRVLLPDGAAGSTVGGVLAVGASDHRRLGWGPVRDCVLEVRYVSAEGVLVKAGGPTVKNVSGFDLCRLLVGSLGTLGLLAEVVLRTQPRPEVTSWWQAAIDPVSLRPRLHRPMSILWDGTTTWVGLEGYGVDVEAGARILEGAGATPVAGPPVLPPCRWSVDPATLGSPDERWGRAWIAEVGVGVVHAQVAAPPAPPAPAVVALNRRIKARFDPTGRMNPGRDPLGVAP